MKNWKKVVIKVFACLFLMIGLLSTFATIYVDYLQSPWLVGANYLPAESTNKEMIGVYVRLLCFLLFVVSGFMVLAKKNNAYRIFLLALVVYTIVVPLMNLSNFHYSYVLSELWYDILITTIATGVPICLIFLELKKQKTSQYS